MTAASSIADRLRIDSVDPEELQIILLDFFSRLAHFHDKKIGFGREENRHSIILVFDKSGKISGAEKGELYNEDEVDVLSKLIDDCLISGDEVAIASQVMFSGMPFKGYFRYKDLFQLTSVPDEAPKPESMIGEHPFLLEVAFRNSESLSVRIHRSAVTLDEIQLVCSALLGPRVLSLPKATRFHWVLEQSNQDFVSVYRQGGYVWNGFRGLSGTEFSAVDTLPAAKQMSPQEYYTANFISVEESLAIPDTLTHSLDRYFSLNELLRDKFISACYWFQKSQMIMELSSSAAFVALVSAIEALLTASAGQHCEACGRSTGKGPTALFEEFIETYVPDASANRATRKALYSLRSQITHGNKILRSDRGGWTPGFKHSQEYADRSRLFSTVRVALVNWLHSQ